MREVKFTIYDLRFTIYEWLYSRIRKYFYFVILIFVSNFSIAQKSPSSVNDLKKKAEKFFNEEKYNEAVPFYSQLLSLESQSPVYNYRYGVCLLYTGKDKTQAAVFLESAARFPTTKPEVHLYLGISYMYAEHYREAIGQFEEYKKTGNASKEGKLKADRLIKNCQSAVELNKDRKNITITGQKQVNRNTFYSNYDFSETSGKMLTATDNFLTPIDKQKSNRPVMFMTNDGQTIYYASYGKKGDKGKDIYKVVKISGDKWSDPVNLGDKINTERNEDYPYLDRDGKTLYFCSEGHSSIGGYDIFKSVYDFANDEWSEPVNIGIPINTPDDDILYIPNLRGDQAVYSTAVESEFGKIEIREIRLSDVAVNVAVIKGVYVSRDQAMRHDARITVVRGSNNGVVTSIHTNPRTGEYELVLPPGNDYMLVVEGGSYLPHAESFSLPPIVPGLSLKQKVMMDKQSNTEKMTLSNFFNAPLASTHGTTKDSLTADVPTEVKSSELNVSTLDSSKLKSVTIDGKVIYVAAPSTASVDKNSVVPSNDKNLSANEEVVSSTKNSNSANQNIPSGNEQKISAKEKPEENITAKGNNTEKNQLGSSSNSSASSQTQESKEEKTVSAIENEKVMQSENNTDTPEMGKQNFSSVPDSVAENSPPQDTDKKSIGDEANQQENSKQGDNSVSSSEPVITAKTSNAELVKICFTEAYSLRTEVLTIKEQAKQRTDESRRLDTLAKNQANQAEQLVSSNKELSKQLFSESKETANQAEIKMKEAEALTAEATEKEKEADEASKEASQLMKELKVDTQAVAYRSISKSKQKKEGHNGKTEKQSDVAGLSNSSISQNTDSLLSGKPQTATAANKNPDEQKLVNASSLTHLDKANTLKAESESLAGRSLDAKQKAQATNDRKEKSALQKQANDLKKESTTKKLEADKEFALATKEEKEKNANVGQRTASATPEAKSKGLNEKASKSTSENADRPPSSTNATATVNKTATSNTTIAPEAASHFQKYTEKINESKETDKQADNIDKQILNAANTKQRDSLTVKSNDLRHLALIQWQEGQKELVLAKSADPDVEEKMKASNELAVDASAIKSDKKDNALTKSNTSAEQESTVGQQQDNSKSALTTQERKDNNPNNKQTSLKEQSANTAPAKQPLQNNTQKTSVSKSGSSPSNDSSLTIMLDTTRAEYPKYKETLAQIDVKQTETVNTFIEGMQINKKAIAVKEEELRLRDQAQVEKNTKKKEQLLAQADSVKAKADSLIKLSNEKLSTAQKNTRVVKDLTSQSDKLKSKLIVTPAHPEQSEKPAMVAESNPAPVKSSEKSNPPAIEKTETASEKQVASDVHPESKNGTTGSMTMENIPPTEKNNNSNTENSAEKASVPFITKNKSTTKETTQTESISSKDIVKTNTDSSATVNENKTTADLKPETLQNKPLDKSDSNTEPSTVSKSEMSPPQKESSVLDNTSALPNVSSNKSGQSEDTKTKNEDSKTEPARADNSEKSSLKEKSSTSDKSETLRSKSEQASSKPETAKNKLAVKSKASPSVADETANTSSPVSATNAVLPASYAPSDGETFKVSKTPSYSANNKIPMDVSLPEGLIFKVQIGAFKTPLPDNAFGGLQPLSAETSRPGWIRYCLGMFRSFEPANLLKKDVQALGYHDAFVVAYLNGKRISLNEAYSAMNKASAEEKKMYADISDKEFKHLAKFDISNAKFADTPDADTKSFYGTTESVPSDLVEYAVQVGAYKTSKTPLGLTSFLPLNTEKIASGLYRFTTGRFSNYSSADSMKKAAITTGVKDAFIVVYKGGSTLSHNEAVALLRKDKTATNPTTANKVNSEASTATTPPLPDASNQYLASDIIFKVQLGAYRENVPMNIVNSFLTLSDKGITQETDTRGYHIFYIGKYKSYDEAIVAKNEVVSKGVKDAFVAAFANDKRISVNEAQNILNKK